MADLASLQDMAPTRMSTHSVVGDKSTQQGLHLRRAGLTKVRTTHPGRWCQFPKWRYLSYETGISSLAKCPAFRTDRLTLFCTTSTPGVWVSCTRNQKNMSPLISCNVRYLGTCRLAGSRSRSRGSGPAACAAALRLSFNLSLGREQAVRYSGQDSESVQTNETFILRRKHMLTGSERLSGSARCS